MGHQRYRGRWQPASLRRAHGTADSSEGSARAQLSAGSERSATTFFASTTSVSEVFLYAYPNNGFLQRAESACVRITASAPEDQEPLLQVDNHCFG